MQHRWNEPATADRVRALASDIDTYGFARLHDFISPDELAPLRTFAEQAVEPSIEGYAGFVGSSDFEGTVWHSIPQNPAFRELCGDICEHSTSHRMDGPFYQIFRCLRGGGGPGHSMKFHYDSYALTILVPISIPPEGAPGNLLVFPSTRPVRRTYIRNLVDKVAVDIVLTQKALVRRSRNPKNVVSIPMAPGEAYLFWGYRSLHTNEGCDPRELRSTALLHYGDPHRGDALRVGVRRLRALKSA